MLRSIYGAKVTAPTACVVSRWASDPFSRGSYSFVAVGASGKDYDALAAPVARRLLWAGEHTCKEHPDTVGGAMLTVRGAGVWGGGELGRRAGRGRGCAGLRHRCSARMPPAGDGASVPA